MLLPRITLSLLLRSLGVERHVHWWNHCHGGSSIVLFQKQRKHTRLRAPTRTHPLQVPSVHGSGAIGLKTINPKPAGCQEPGRQTLNRYRH